MARFYPRGALSRGVGGRVVALCDTDGMGVITACSPLSETPTGYGFAEAARQVFVGARIGPVDRAGEATAGRPVRVTIGWAPQGLR